MRTHLRWTTFVVVVAVVATCGDISRASLAKLTGGGYSGTLSKNKAIRKQQLICDPATGTTTPGPLVLGAPRAGSTSITYDPSIVSLSGFDLATGYQGTALVEVKSGSSVFLQDIVSFMSAPEGTETGYAQCFYQHGPSTLLEQAAAGGSGQTGSLGILQRDLAKIAAAPVLKGPTGEPGQTPLADNFTFSDNDGVKGFDTHQFFFTYRNTAADTDVATYNIYADKATRASGNNTDFVIAFNNGKETFVGPDMLSSARVSGSLAVPLPPAVWSGAAMLVIVGASITFARRRSRTE